MTENRVSMFFVYSPSTASSNIKEKKEEKECGHFDIITDLNNKNDAPFSLYCHRYHQCKSNRRISTQVLIKHQHSDETFCALFSIQRVIHLD
jgi:hypothetical protein